LRARWQPVLLLRVFSGSQCSVGRAALRLTTCHLNKKEN
jgi:hypothetical protein